MSSRATLPSHRYNTRIALLSPVTADVSDWQCANCRVDHIMARDNMMRLKMFVG